MRLPASPLTSTWSQPSATVECIPAEPTPRLSAPVRPVAALHSRPVWTVSAETLSAIRCMDDELREPWSVTEADVGDEDAAPTTAPYVFDPTDVSAAVAIVDAVFTDLDFRFATINRFVETAKARSIDGTPLEAELVDAAGHLLHREVGGKPGCELGRSGLDDVRGWPRPIAEAPPDVVRLWREVAATATAPAAIAHFEDLLFVKRDGNGRERVRRAVGAYLAAVDAADELGMDEVDALLRVWSLGRAVREPDIDDEVRRRMMAIADQVMTMTPGASPGVALPMLSALAVGPVRAGVDLHDVDVALARAASMYVADYHATQIAADRRSRAGGDKAELERIAREEVAAYFTTAEAASNPAVRMIHLNDAARVATQRGLPDLARRASALMQQIKPAELGLKRIRVETPIPPYLPETFLAGFTAGPTWRDGLGYLFSGDPPSGSIEQVRKLGKESRGPLVSLFPTTIFGAGGLPRVSTQSDDDGEAHGMSRAASISALHYGRWIAQGLMRMGEVYELPSVDELTSALVAMGCSDPQLARGLAKGLRLFWDGDYEASIAVALPKFEAAARALLRELDEGIYRVQLGKDPGGYVGLYVLLDELERVALDPSWAYFFRWLLLGPYGANLRNDIAHGFVFDPGPVFAALTIRAVAVLALVAGILPDDRLSAEPEDRSGNCRSRDELLATLAHPTGRPSRLGRVLGGVANTLERCAWWLRARRTSTSASHRTDAANPEG